MKLKTNLHTILCALVIISCVKDKDFETPELVINTPDLSGLESTTFSAVKSAYEQAKANGNNTVVFENDLYITGYVVSSDQAGNFFEELIVQNSVDGNSPDNDERLGFRLSINRSSLYQLYEFGRKVYIKLKGLTFGETNGVYTLGKGTGSSVEQIQDYELREYVIRSEDVVTILPKVTTIPGLIDTDENTYLQLEDVQFNAEMLELTYAGEKYDEFDGFRYIESCSDSPKLVMQTSTFADFKSLPLAKKRGAIKGVLSKDFRGEFKVLAINSISDIEFNEADRCASEILNCESTTSTAHTVLFEEDFETMTSFENSGWTNTNINGGSSLFTLARYSGLSYAQVRAFNSNETSMEAWLISPAINLDTSTNEVLAFETRTGYNNGPGLSIWVSSDYSGNIANATWLKIDSAVIANGPSNDYEIEFTNSGRIDISCVSGDIHVAFRYIGGDGAITTTFQIDNITLTGDQ